MRREARGHLLHLLLQLRGLEAGLKRGTLIQGFHSFGKCLLIAYPVHGVQGWSEDKEYRPTWTGMTQLYRCDKSHQRGTQGAPKELTNRQDPNSWGRGEGPDSSSPK